jgi:mannose-1-phosphate guanylyltransferase/mannose-6-phosphate isomerase
MVPVIMAGGSGTRLWPLSRGQYPKQFLKLFGNHTMLQNTVLRAMALKDAQPPVVICNQAHRFIVAEQLQALGIQPTAILLEPEGRNTAPATAIAALLVAEKFGAETVLNLMAADHTIPDQAAYAEATYQAVAVAQQGKIVTFGIQPTRPETGYGYMKAGAASSNSFAIAAFVEKPKLEVAQQYLAEGGYYWNGGMFIFRADVMLAELSRFESQLLDDCRAALAAARHDLDFVRLEEASFGRVRNESLDYAVMEKTDKAALVPLNAGWDDVGSWTYMDALDKDPDGNAATGDVLFSNSRNNLVHADSRLVTLAGIDNAVVVETEDAVLVTTKDHAQEVKNIVSALRKAKRPEADFHARVYRPWGWYETISLSDRYQVKRILVKSGQKLSLQMHHHRAEHWIVVKGTAQITCDDKVFLMAENQSCYIPLGAKHRLDNPGKFDLELIEVQSGSYLGEDDIVRFEDVYGRTS